MKSGFMWTVALQLPQLEAERPHVKHPLRVGHLTPEIKVGPARGGGRLPQPDYPTTARMGNVVTTSMTRTAIS